VKMLTHSFNVSVDISYKYQTRNQCSRDARQHQFKFVRRLSWSISSIFQRKFTLSVRHSLK